MLQVPGGRKVLDFQVALDRTGRWPCKVHHSHQKALVRACSYLWWMGWLYRILRSGWRASTEKCWWVIHCFSSIILPQQHQTHASINRRMDFVPSVGISWCFGMAGVLTPVWEGVRVLGLERRCRTGTRSLQCQQTAAACCKVKPHVCRG